MFTNLFTATAAMAATVSAFDCSGNYFSFFNRAGPMSYQRLDPALSPGKQGPHMHTFDGGNALSASSNFDSQVGSSCTTARIKPDKSLYWRPTLYWNGNNTGFYRVPENAAKIYYKFGDGNSWANVTEFPEDFNMMAGDPFKRADGSNSAGVRWACHQPDGRSDNVFSNGFPSGFQSCNSGFASEVTFPSCWNGKALNPSSPSAHMAYPTNGGVGIENCPTTHRAARFPTIFIEFWYDISSFNGQYSSSSNPWVLSNGDPTGFGMHADFLNGWEKGVLGKATAESGGCNCGCGCGNDEMKQCFGAANVNDDGDSSFKQCSAGTSGSAAKVDKLPGCNPIQSGPARATVASGAGCDASAAPVASAASTATSAASSVASGIASAIESAYSDVFSATVPAGASVTASAAAYAYSSPAPYPFPSGNSTVAPTATGVNSSPAGVSSKSRLGHNHSKFHSSKTTAVPAGNTGHPTSDDKDTEAEAASASCTSQAPVTITYTPTVYVTAQSVSAALNSTTTLTLTSTVIMKQTLRAAASGY
ncbi:uncharacterized protein M421DRAFT_419888 [Didymella exigua CBS 183.55]|uniref:DUF1996 domain-containing protein n=1 Tax=Didymella exigua CBS 183.55 TaxID=1150837 RepID=A0A6A5RSP1_9PLEO|nr:uncharacterized protein M421DRAFT_419888 [Didymella exigua CBS 183.55]KAF1929356.1 hypothetical protein M421DRAFT_419888 [Didymella exigua CBS 183.55]